MRYAGKEALIIFVGVALLFSAFYGGRELMSYECRNGVFAREMLLNGPSFFPTLYGKPYADYPGTHTFLICMGYKILGGLGAESLAFPSALAAALGVALAYLIGATRSRAWAWAAVIILLGTYGFVSAARMPSPDHFITAITAASFYLALLHRERGGLWRVALMPLLFLVGFALRGPLGVVIPVAAACACYASEFEWRKGFSGAFKSLQWGLLVGVLGLLCLVAGLLVLRWGAQLQGGEDFIREAWDAQVGGRMSAVKGKVFYYYLLDGLPIYALAFPLALLVSCVLGKKLLDRDNEDMRFLRALLCWALFVIGGLSIPGTKHLRYILPAIPALALIGAYMFLPGRTEKIFLKLRGFMGWLCAAAPFAGVLSCVPAFMLVRMHNIVVPYAWLLPLLLLGLALIVWRQLKQFWCEEWRQNLWRIAVGVLVFNFINMLAAEPVMSFFERSRPFVQLAEAKRGPEDKLIFFKCGPDDLDVKYVFNTDKFIIPEFMGADENLAEVPEAALLIAKKKDFEHTAKDALAPFIVVAEGKLGRKDCVAFRRGTGKE